MAENQFPSTVDALFKGMDHFITSKTVVGEPVKVELCGLMLFCVGFGMTWALILPTTFFLLNYGGSAYDRGINFNFAGKTGQMSDAGSSILIFSGKGVEKRHTAFLLLS